MCVFNAKKLNFLFLLFQEWFEEIPKEGRDQDMIEGISKHRSQSGGPEEGLDPQFFSFSAPNLVDEYDTPSVFCMLSIRQKNNKRILMIHSSPKPGPHYLLVCCVALFRQIA